MLTKVAVLSAAIRPVLIRPQLALALIAVTMVVINPSLTIKALVPVTLMAVADPTAKMPVLPIKPKS